MAVELRACVRSPCVQTKSFHECFKSQPDTEWLPEAHVLFTMTPVERNYAQIEKEDNGGSVQLREVYMGGSSILGTDHKILLAISQKPQGDALHSAL